jgi:threonine dehydrogenase-like Zn-dependent dehydrogenase
MRGVRSDGAGGVAVVDVDLTTPDYAADPVIVHVRSCSICGSDLKMLDYGLTCTLGHEFGGVLDDGTVVAVQPGKPCGVCDMCRAGKESLCRVVFAAFHGISIDGGLADDVVVDRSCLVPLPDGVPPEHAALVEPLAVCVHSANNAGLVDGRTADGPVLVIGAGSIGLAMVAVLRHRGFAVDLEARHPRQHEGGERLGARFSVADEYPVVVDAAGTQSSLDEAITHLRPGGTLAVVSTYWDPVNIDVGLLMKEARLVPATIYGHFRGEREFDQAAAVLAGNPEIVDVLVSHRFALDDVAEAFRTAQDRAAGAVKVVLEP